MVYFIEVLLYSFIHCWLWGFLVLFASGLRSAIDCSVYPGEGSLHHSLQWGSILTLLGEGPVFHFHVDSFFLFGIYMQQLHTFPKRNLMSLTWNYIDLTGKFMQMIFSDSNSLHIWMHNVLHFLKNFLLFPGGTELFPC